MHTNDKLLHHGKISHDSASRELTGTGNTNNWKEMTVCWLELNAISTVYTTLRL